MNLKTQNLVMGGLALIAVLYLYKTFFLGSKGDSTPSSCRRLWILNRHQVVRRAQTPGMISGVPTPTDMGVQTAKP